MTKKAATQFEALIDSLDLSTRSARRQVTSLAIGLLECIQSAEEDNVNNFPDNLQNSERYENAEHSLTALTDAIDSLTDAY